MPKAVEDLLNRRPFAKDLAQKLFTFSLAESRVVGIIGDWGIGKTTFLNYLEEASQELPSVDTRPRPVIVHFNPWWFSGREDLILRFFNEMALTLGKTQNLRYVATALKQVAKGISATTSVLSLFGVPAPFVGIVAKAAQATADAIEPPQQSLDDLPPFTPGTID